MKELPEQFVGRGEVRGFLFTQVESNANGYVYRVQHHPMSKPYFEAFKRKVNTRFGAVSYPSAKAFGAWAIWTFDMDRAKQYIGA